MFENEQTIQQLKRDGRHNKQVYRRYPVYMIAEKRLPSLRRRSPVPRHMFGYGSLADIDAKLQQFAVNPRSTVPVAN